MSWEYIFTTATDYMLFFSCVFILAGSIYITFKLKFVQFRFLPDLFRMFKESYLNRHQEEGRHTILPHKALLMAMSTTLGISTIVGPVIAIHLGGPGAVLGFVLTSFFGSAATYAEVDLSIKHRKKLPSGVIMGGPMQYLKALFSPKAAAWYALSCLILMSAWSGAQANQLAAILDSPLLGSYRIPVIATGLTTGILIFVTLAGGIKRIGALSAKLVPTMFVLYICSSLWIIAANADKLLDVFRMMFEASFSPYAMASGTLVGGIMSSLRWGIFKGMQASEAGIGTQAIPHAMAETSNPATQGMLAMLSTYTSGFVAFLSGCVALITNTWQDPHLPLGMSMVAASFEMYFSSFGIAIVAVTTILFAFGTILGNSYNGSQCFSYLTQNRGLRYYFLASAVMVFVGSIAEVKTFWSLIDIFLVAMALPHMTALILYTFQSSEEIVRGINVSMNRGTPLSLLEEKET